MNYTDLDTGESGEFMQIRAGGMPLLSALAESSKGAYDQHLRAQYDALLSSHEAEIKGLLGAA